MEREELETWILAHQAELYRYLRFLGAEPASAEDLVQETFLAAFRHPAAPTQELERARAAWLRAIARNLFLVQCRRKRNSPVTVNSETIERAEDYWTSEFLRGEDGFEVTDALRACLGKLEQKKRDLIDGFYARRKSRAELAQLFEMSEDGIKSLMRRVRGELALCIRRRLASEKAG